jgi:hypothetical protein
MVLPLLFALLVRAAIPAGFMLAPDASGHLALVLCSGTGPLGASDGTVPALHHHHHAASSDAAGEHPQPIHKADSLCPFAGSAGPAPVPAVTAAPLPAPGHIVVVEVGPGSSTISTILRAQQARGPPVVL